TLKIAGKGPDSDLLKEKVYEYGLESSVDILGFIEDKEAFYTTLDVFVFAGDWELEGFGMVIAEAMSYGISCVVIDQKPMSEVIGDSGVVVNNSNEALAQGLIRVLKDKKLRKSLNLKAHKRAKKFFDIKKQVALVKNELQKVVNQRYL